MLDYNRFYSIFIDDGYSGGFAISPSMEVLVVCNLWDGVDWYDIWSGKHVTMTTYEVGGKVMGQIVFLSEKDIIIGHSGGALVTASFQQPTRNIPGFLKFLPGQRCKYLVNGH